MAKKRGLSKGLDALLQSSRSAVEPEEVAIDEVESKPETTTKKEPVDGELRKLPVEFLQRGRYQPRRDMRTEALEELAASIKSQGLMQPIVVRSIAEQKYEIIAGERRWRAAQMAGLAEVPCVIRTVPDEAAIAMALIENIQREDLNPMEEAIALSRLQEEFELTHQQVAEAVGKSRATVTNLLRLISLNTDVKTMLEHGDLEMGHARALLGLQGQTQSEIARDVVSKGMSVRQTEALVRSALNPKSQDKPAKEDPNVKELINRLQDTLGAPVQIQNNAAGKGKITINFNSLDELDGILEHIK